MKTKGRKPIPVRIVPSESTAPQTYREKDRLHISVRQIKNGYLINENGVRNGRHFDDEYYTPNKPSVSAKAPRSGGAPRRGVTSRTKL